jgi:hypothetical protein
MGTNPKVCFLGGKGGRSLVVFQGRKVGFKKISKECFFGGVGWGGWKKGLGIFFFVFCSFVIW